MQLHKIFPTIFLIVSLINHCAAQQKIQVETINDSMYVVQLIPVETARKNISSQITQVDKQLDYIDRQISDLEKKRHEAQKQKTALEFADAQLTQAAAAPSTTKPVTTPPATEKKPAPKKKVPKKKPKTKE